MAADEKYPIALPAGTVLAGQYTIDKVLGQGGFGITYKATDYKTNNKVAVKEFFPDTLAYREMTNVISYPGERSENYEYGKEGFLQEAKTLAEFIGCENIVRIHSYFEENGTAYFVMDYIEGTSFDEYLKQKGGKISCEEAKGILIPVMEALAVVHSKGIVHRDVTPDNIYITNDGTVKLLDFGAARYSLGDKSRSLDVILKHGFAPKEQYTRRGKQGPFTDVYSLGATFYFALTGKRPPDSVERLDEDDLVPPSNLGVQITEYQEEAILKALSVQPGDRYQSMTEFRDTFLNEASSSVQPTPVVQQFFTAPAQQSVGVSQQPVNADTENTLQITQAVNTTDVKTKFKRNKKPIIIAASAFAVVGIIAGSVIAGSMNSKETDNISTLASYEDNKPKTTTTFVGVGAMGTVGTTIAAQSTTTALPTETEATPVTTTAAPVSAGDAAIIGNRVGNIANGGLIPVPMRYYISENYHAIKTENSDGETINLLKDNGEFSNLVLEGDNLYFIYNGQIYRYSISANTHEIVPELKSYSDTDMRLYLSNDYYFVYTGNYDEGGVLYRISRSTGKEEQNIRIKDESSFIFFGDCLYYIESESEKDYLYCVSSLDFNDTMNDRNYDGQMITVTACDNYIYLVLKNSNNEVIIEKLTNDLNEIVNAYNITNMCKKYVGDDFGISMMNVIDDQMFISVYDTENYSSGLYHIVDNSDGTFTYGEAIPYGSGVWSCSVRKDDDYYEVYYMSSNGQLQSIKYDMNGKFIEN